MPYRGVKTWAAGPWRFSEANAYISDNMDSSRRTVQSIVPATSTAAGPIPIVNGHYYHRQVALCPTPPDEPFRVVILWTVQPTTDGTNTALNLHMMAIDHNNVAMMTEVDYGVANESTSTTVVQHSFECSAVYDAGVNPGYALQLYQDINSGTGTPSVFINSVAWVVPLV